MHQNHDKLLPTFAWKEKKKLMVVSLFQLGTLLCCIWYSKSFILLLHWPFFQKVCQSVDGKKGQLQKLVNVRKAKGRKQKTKHSEGHI